MSGRSGNSEDLSWANGWNQLLLLGVFWLNRSREFLLQFAPDFVRIIHDEDDDENDDDLDDDDDDDVDDDDDDDDADEDDDDDDKVDATNG